MPDEDKPLVWLHGEIKTPPLSAEARVGAGVLLRRIQRGESIGMPHSRPIPSIGRACHELRIRDRDATWRVIHRIDADAVVIVEVFNKKSEKTPQTLVETCKKRLRDYDAAAKGKKES